MKSKLLIPFFSFLFLKSFCQVDFEQHNIIDNLYSINHPTTVIAADIDGDSDADIIFGTVSGGQLYIIENIDGQGHFDSPQIIDYFADGLRSVVAKDVDGDGDLDLVIASSNNFDDRIAWYENLDAQGNFSSQKIISENVNFPLSVNTADIDGDGDQDILSASSDDHKIAWYENTNGLGNFGSQQIIGEADRANYVISADIDGDGDLDILASYFPFPMEEKLVWYENIDGLGSFSNEKIISTSHTKDIIPTDMDNDGDVDIISTSPSLNKISWFENTDGLGNFGIEHVITMAESSQSINYKDLDGDGDLDLISSGNWGDNKISWYENLDGLGNFGTQQIITTKVDIIQFVYATDLDGDDIVDVISASYADDKIAWYQNVDGLGNFGEQQVLTPRLWGAQRIVHPIDYDNDGDLDLLIPAGQGRRIAWFENMDGLGQFDEQKILTDSIDYADKIFPNDLDGDGDQDILTFSFSEDNMTWYENIDGQGTLSAPQIISEDVNNPSGAAAIDMDGDGDLDVVSASFSDKKLAWYENIDGQGNFGIQQVLNTDAGYLLAIDDINGDGFLDFVSASINDSIFWFENINGSGNFSTPQFITKDIMALTVITTKDIDNDGDIDLLSASYTDNKIAWYENIDGQGDFGSQKIITTDATGVQSVEIKDIDKDGDLDIISASLQNIAWYENMDGQGNFGTPNTIFVENGNSFVVGADIDGDDDLDLVSSAQFGILNWYENLNSTSIFEKEKTDFLLFPIPATDVLQIQSEILITRVEIFDAIGQLVLVVEGDSYSEINISSLDTGFYFCKAINEEGEWGIKKMFKY